MVSNEKSITIHLSDIVMRWLEMKACADYRKPEQMVEMMIFREYQEEKLKIGEAIRESLILS